MAAMTFYFFAFLTGFSTGTTMALEGGIFKSAGDVAAMLPAPVRKTVGALARSSPARTAADALVGLFLGMVCVMFTATFFNVVAVRACGGNCSLARVLSDISDYSETLSLLLLAPTVALFFLRAAGCRSLEVAESLNIKDFNEAVAVAGVFLAIISLIIQSPQISDILGVANQSPQISGILGVAAMFCAHLFIILFYIRAARALWRMNRRPAIEWWQSSAASPTQVAGAQAEFRAGSSKMMEIEYYTTSAGVLLFPSYYSLRPDSIYIHFCDK